MSRKTRLTKFRDYDENDIKNKKRNNKKKRAIKNARKAKFGKRNDWTQSDPE